MTTCPHCCDEITCTRTNEIADLRAQLEKVREELDKTRALVVSRTENGDDIAKERDAARKRVKELEGALKRTMACSGMGPGRALCHDCISYARAALAGKEGG